MAAERSRTTSRSDRKPKATRRDHRSPRRNDSRSHSSDRGSSPMGGRSTDDRSDRMRDRTEREQEAKRRARNGGDSSRSRTPGAATSAATVSTEDSRQTIRRTEEEQQAKRRARDGRPSSTVAAAAAAAAAPNNIRPIPPPTPNPSNQNQNPPAVEAMELHAEVVNEDEDEIERTKQQLQQENERLRAQMDRENAELRRQMAQQRHNNNNPIGMIGAVQGEVVVVEASEVTNDPDDENKLVSKKCSITAVILILLMVGGGVGAYFGLKEPSEDPILGFTGSSTPLPPTPTAPPLTPSPTQAPTPDVLVFPKPTPADCLAVISGGQVEGQEFLETREFEIDVIVSMQEATNETEILDALRLTTQVLIVPELVGCIGDGRRRKLSANHDTSRLRNLQQDTVDPRRYAIANGNFVSNYMSDQICTSLGDGPCHHVVTTLSLAIKDENESDFLLLTLLGDVYGVEDLKSKLLLATPFDTVALEIITPIQEVANGPTNAPMADTPIPAPSPPTNAPTGSIQTTILPVPSPTNAPADNTLCAANCVGDVPCDFTEVTVGCGSCLGRDTCDGMIDSAIGNGSCIGTEACSSLMDVIIGDDSCLEDLSCGCLATGTVLQANSCQSAGECCSLNGGPLEIGLNSCQPQNLRTCQMASGPIGDDSCNEVELGCYKSKADIGSDACNLGGCQETWGTILDESCNGFQACPRRTDMIIGRNSCNCENCCSCLEGNAFVEIPDNSCNELAPTEDGIDFSVDTELMGPFETCCSS